MSSTDDIAEALAGVPNIDASLIGTFVQVSGVQAVVDVGSARVTIPTLGQYFPVPGDLVRLLRVDKLLFLLGPASPKSPVGRVSATGSPRCTVEYPSGSGVTKDMGYPSNITPAVNDIVLIDWTSGGTIVDKITVAPVNTPPGAPGAGTALVAKSQTFTAIDSGSWTGSRWFTADVYSSASNLGAWFYGSKIHDTIEDTAIIDSVEIYLPLRAKNASGTPNLGYHTSDEKGAGVSFVTTIGAPGTSGWVTLPTTWIDYLKANAGGIGFNHGGYWIWHGVQTDGLSGALRVSWRA